MVYRTENMLLEPIHEVLHGTHNDVVICRDRNSPVAAKYTLWIVHDRGCIRALLDLFENSPRELLEGESPYLARFAEGESLCFLFDYRPARPLRRFAPGQAVSVQQREQIGIDVYKRQPLGMVVFHNISRVSGSGNWNSTMNFMRRKNAGSMLCL